MQYFIGYTDDNIIRPSCIILPQMSRYVKYFGSGGKNMCFKTEGDNIFLKYNEVWNKIKKYVTWNFIVNLFMMKNT